MSNKGQMLQDPFLNTLRKEHVPVSIYLVNGIKLQGQIESFDQYVVLLKNTVTQMVYKHAISTVVPRGRSRCLTTPASRRRELTRRVEPHGAPAPPVSGARRGARPLMFERPTAAIARCWSPSTSAAAIASTASQELAVLADVRRRDRSWARSPAARAPDPALFAGTGKVDEIAARAARAGAGSRDLRPCALRRQQRNLERRARVPRGRPRQPHPRHLRAARAQRRRQAAGRAGPACSTSPRAWCGGWTHLERQNGGIGLRGPGETQLETDRRLIGKRVKLLNARASRAWRAAAPCSAGRAGAPRCAPWRSSATPTPASRRCSTA